MDSFNKAVDSYIDALKVKLEGKIDFEGQRSAEKWTQTLLSISTALAFVIGYFMQSMIVTFGIYVVGLIITLLVVVPPWSCYNKHPITWLPRLDPKTKEPTQAKNLKQQPKI